MLYEITTVNSIESACLVSATATQIAVKDNRNLRSLKKKLLEFAQNRGDLVCYLTTKARENDIIRDNRSELPRMCVPSECSIDCCLRQ